MGMQSSNKNKQNFSKAMNVPAHWLKENNINVTDLPCKVFYRLNLTTFNPIMFVFRLIEKVFKFSSLCYNFLPQEKGTALFEEN